MIMKKSLFFLLSAVLLASMPAAAQQKPKRVKTPPPALAAHSGEQQKGKPEQPVKMSTGFFNIGKHGNDLFLAVPDGMLGKRFLATVRYTSTPVGTGKYGGELVADHTLYWQKLPNGKLALRKDLNVVRANEFDDIALAVKAANEDPIVGTFDVSDKSDKGTSRIQISQFLLSGNDVLGLNNGAREALGLARMSTAASYVESAKTFPCNTEIRLMTTWGTSPSKRTPSGQMAGAASVGLNISFIKLPESPMRPRLFDPRVGYFTNSFTSYGDEQQRVERKLYAVRWRLEPKDSADAERLKRGELIEPAKPIVFYIDPATPKRWRKYLILGVEDWQVAFEQAGFKNAIQAREWPEGVDSMSMEDARYSVIRYLASDIQNAYGPQVHDPRTGEILESHICWYHNVMQLVHDWYMVQAGSIDEAARMMHFDDELMGQLIRFVSSHEVGHTLGLRHNFGSSSTVPVEKLRDKAWVEAHGHTPSIMDYARFNYVAQPEDGISRDGIFPRIGDYDKWAIQWGYTPTWNAGGDLGDHYELEPLVQEKLKDRRLWFGEGEMRRTDPRCQTEDLGDDPCLAGHYGILNLKRELEQLPAWSYRRGDVLSTDLNSTVGIVLSQFNRYLNHAASYIGGTYIDFKTVDEPGAVYTVVPRERQKACLDFIDEQVLKEPTWISQSEVVARVSNDPVERAATLGRNMITRLTDADLLGRLKKEYTAEEFLDDLADKLFTECQSGQKPSVYRAELQGMFVQQLCARFAGAHVGSPVRGALLVSLRNLRARLKPHESIATFASLVDAIDRTLVVK